LENWKKGDESMNILIVYFSRDGHTKKIAQALGEQLQADVEEIQEIKNRKGFMGWLSCCRDAILKKSPSIKLLSKNPLEYDLIIVGSPVWAFTIVPAIRLWLNQYGPQLKQTVFFVTMGGQGAKRSFQVMERLCGHPPRLTESFIDKDIEKNHHQNKFDAFVQQIKAIAK
jgi:flavodoxin